MNDTEINGNSNGGGTGGRVWLHQAARQRIMAIEPAALKVYLDLLTYVGSGLWECWPAMATIANDVGLSRPSVKRCLRSLRDAGLIDVEPRQHECGYPKSNMYRILPLWTDGGRVMGEPTPSCLEGSPVNRGRVMGEPGVGSWVTPDQNSLIRTHRTEQEPSCPGKVPDVETGGSGNSRKAAKKKPVFTPEDLATASWMFAKILVLNPDHKKPNLESWANTIRLMRERDGRTDARIREVFAWANADSFWAGVILSPENLRKQFDRLSTQEKTGSKNGSSSYDAQRRAESARGRHVRKPA
jgi:hypothetical protein